jgi:hypothetical protein
VAAAHHDDALAFTRGHPLALSLTADVLTRGDRVVPSRLEAEPEVVRLLIEKFVQDVPSRAHRLALHTCVSARATTEPLLAAALDQADVHDVFEWLGRLSFVESGPYGLFPHDLARDVVYMDFRWRDPDAAYRVTERLIAYLYGRLERTQGFEVADLVRRDLCAARNSRLRPYMDWEGLGRRRDRGDGESHHEVWFSKRSNGTRGRPRPRSRATGWRASPRRFSSHAAWPASSPGSSRTCASQPPRPTLPRIPPSPQLWRMPSGTPRQDRAST